ncbi:MAG: NifU N-terminal domain-containing protein [Salinibacter sp.]
MPTTQAERTPNPNSLKFTTDDGPFLQDGVAAYSSEAEAEKHPLAQRLFSITGVEDVFMTPQFVTVSKGPEVDWTAVKPDVEAALAEYLEAA